MTHVEIKVEGGGSQTVKLDRVPVKGDLVILRNEGMFRVKDVALVVGGMMEGIALVEEARDVAAGLAEAAR